MGWSRAAMFCTQILSIFGNRVRCCLQTCDFSCKKVGKIYSLERKWAISSTQTDTTHHVMNSNLRISYHSMYGSICSFFSSRVITWSLVSRVFFLYTLWCCKAWMNLAMTTSPRPRQRRHPKRPQVQRAPKVNQKPKQKRRPRPRRPKARRRMRRLRARKKHLHQKRFSRSLMTPRRHLGNALLQARLGRPTHRLKVWRGLPARSTKASRFPSTTTRTPTPLASRSMGPRRWQWLVSICGSQDQWYLISMKSYFNDILFQWYLISMNIGHFHPSQCLRVQAGWWHAAWEGGRNRSYKAEAKLEIYSISSYISWRSLSIYEVFEDYRRICSVVQDFFN